MFLYFTQMDDIDEDVRQTLERKGWRPRHLPFRRVVFNTSTIDPNAFDLLLITSKQAARWLHHYHPGTRTPIAAVGRTTSTLLKDHPLFFGDDPPPNAADLAARLKAQVGPDQRLLFLRGQKASRTLAQEFPKACFTEEIVYHTEQLLEKFPPLEEPAMVYFQAPSSVRDYAAAYLRPPKRIGAIGPTTAKAISELGWKIDFQPERPESHTFAATIPHPDSL